MIDSWRHRWQGDQMLQSPLLEGFSEKETSLEAWRESRTHSSKDLTKIVSHRAWNLTSTQ